MEAHPFTDFMSLLRAGFATSGAELAEDSGDDTAASSAEKLFALGMAFHLEVGVVRDESKAAGLYQLALDGGHLQAALILGEMYLGGAGVVRDEKRGMELYERAEDGGLADAFALRADVYLRGRGVPVDAAKAQELLNCGAERSNVLSLCMLGSLYSDGGAVEKDFRKAANFWEKAIAVGRGEGSIRSTPLIAQAGFLLGNLFYRGLASGRIVEEQ